MADIIKCIVHPAHVPLEAKTQATGVGRPGDSGPFGDSSAIVTVTRYSAIGQRIDLAQEGDGIPVLAAPFRVGRPFTGCRE